MDERKRSHDLAAFKAAFARARAITMSAARSAVALGYGLDDVAAVVASPRSVTVNEPVMYAVFIFVRE